MADDSIIPLILRVLEQDAPYTIPNGSVAPTKISANTGTNGQVLTIVNGVWEPSDASTGGNIDGGTPSSMYYDDITSDGGTP